MNNQPGIAVVVCTHQRPHHLHRCLVSIAVQRGVDVGLEVAVTDDGSTDNTPQVVEEFARTVDFPVRFTTHPHQGYHVARTRNQGAQATSAPYVLFIDGDCVLPPNHLAQHLKHRRPGYSVFGDCYRLDQPASERVTEAVLRTGEFVHWAPTAEVRRLRKLWRRFWYYKLVRHPSKPRLISNNVAVWRRDLEAVNGFDEKFIGWGCEDDDFGMRLRQAGVRFKSILPWTQLYHLWHPIDPTAPQRNWKDGSNAAYVLRQHRLTHCLDGLIKHPIEDLPLAVVGEPAHPEVAQRLLGRHYTQATSTENNEVEVMFHPGTGHFSKRAACKLLVVSEDSPAADRLARQAHVIVADRRYPGVDERYQFPLNEFDRALRAVA